LHWTLAHKPQIQATVVSPYPLGPAEKRAVDQEYLQKQLGRLGNTPYQLTEIELDMQGSPFAASSLLNQLRRQATDLLTQQQADLPAPTILDPVDTLIEALDQTADPLPATEGESPTTTPQLHLLVRTPEQLEAALAFKPATITLDYLDLYGLRPAVEQVQANDIAVRVASPRILKPSEQKIINFLLRLNCEIVVRSAGLLEALQTPDHPPLIGDFSLNAANALTADAFLRMGLKRITPTHDLNAQQVAELAQNIGEEKLEVVAYQHLPVFHTEHCVFCRFLSEGTSKLDCGHPCEKHRVALRDEKGRHRRPAAT